MAVPIHLNSVSESPSLDQTSSLGLLKSFSIASEKLVDKNSELDERQEEASLPPVLVPVPWVIQNRAAQLNLEDSVRLDSLSPRDASATALSNKFTSSQEVQRGSESFSPTQSTNSANATELNFQRHAKLQHIQQTQQARKVALNSQLAESVEQNTPPSSVFKSLTSRLSNSVKNLGNTAQELADSLLIQRAVKPTSSEKSLLPANATPQAPRLSSALDTIADSLISRSANFADKLDIAVQALKEGLTATVLQRQTKTPAADSSMTSNLAQNTHASTATNADSLISRSANVADKPDIAVQALKEGLTATVLQRQTKTPAADSSMTGNLAQNTHASTATNSPSTMPSMANPFTNVTPGFAEPLATKSSPLTNLSDLAKIERTLTQKATTPAASILSQLTNIASVPLETELAQTEIDTKTHEKNSPAPVVLTSAPLELASTMQQKSPIINQPNLPAARQVTREQADVLAMRDSEAQPPAETKFHFNSWGGDQSVVIKGSAQTGYQLHASDSQVQEILEQHEKTHAAFPGKALWGIESAESATDKQNKPRQRHQEEATDE